MSIRYKVVQSSNRNSSHATGRYKRIYTENSIVNSEPGSLGIMCFDTRKHAVDWLDGKTEYMIIRVKTFGRGKRFKNISWSPSQCAINGFLEHRRSIAFVRIPPKGTICYPTVRVLD